LEFLVSKPFQLRIMSDELQMEEKIQKIIDEGGDQIQYDLAKILEENGWNAQISPYYKDIATDKSREIDIIARKEFLVKDDFYNQSERVLVRLFIECKYIKNQVLFYFVKKDKKKATDFFRDNHLLRNEEYLDLQKNHYLKDEEVAKTWRPVEGRDDVYDAWTQSVHSMIYYQKNLNEKIRYVYDLPVVVLKNLDNIFRKEDGTISFSKITSNFQLEIDYSYSLPGSLGELKTYYIDMVSFDNFLPFLKEIEETDVLILKRELGEKLFLRGRQSREQGDGYHFEFI